MVEPWRIRPMRATDVVEAELVSADSFYDLDLQTRVPALPAPQRRSADRSVAWVQRTEHLLRTDPGGCWVAEDDTGLVGVATSLRRELLWGLVTYAVRPGRQGRGTGRTLLEAALGHSRGCLRGMISSSGDPRAVRRYRLAGFELHPQMSLSGTVNRAALPDGMYEKLREGTAGDVDLLDSLDRRTRGAAHGPDHRLLLAANRLLVSDTSTGQGYAYADPSGRLALLAASNRRTAQRLLWGVLADGPDQASVFHVTSANHWALDVGLAARLEVRTDGYLCVRGMKLPSPYVHHGPLL